MRARFYNPALRRFVNQDPIGFAGGMNWFAYAASNPVGLIDPYGRNVYAIDGTWTDARLTGQYSNTYDFYLRAQSAGEESTYFGGPGSSSSKLGDLILQGATGLESDRIARRVYEVIMSDLREGVGNGKVNIVGWSRGATVAVAVSHMLKREDVQVNFLGLYDAVEMVPNHVFPTTIPANVQRFAHAMKTDVADRICPSTQFLMSQNQKAFYQYDGDLSSHRDIGASANSTYAHQWMLSEAMAAGVGIDMSRPIK